MTKPRLLICAGEPAGIGPDIVCALAEASFAAELVVVADRTCLQKRAKQLQLDIEWIEYSPASRVRHQPGQISVLHQAMLAPCVPGQLTLDNAKFPLRILETAVRLCLDKQFDGMVTAPIHKGHINEAGIVFSGHTEFLQQLTGVDLTQMLFVSPELKVALVTTHCPLREVADRIQQPRLEQHIKLLHDGLQRYFRPNPKIAVCGLNPHAGEDGHIGHEEITTITPAITAMRGAGINVSGPFSADTIYHPSHAADAILAMYHDQALPVIKALSFGAAVNVTLGLPFVRTSVDHGTALSLAGSGQAKADSLKQAVQLAIDMVMKNG